jgi:cyclic pyranopterin monophosphate synthase
MTETPENRDLSHIGPDGRAVMVDVGDKPITERAAVAEASVRISTELADHIRRNAVGKKGGGGNLLEVSRLAGIMAAKKTDELIPMCHSLPLDHVDVEASLEGERIRLRATVRTHSRTGVEMEALTAVAVAALTVVDMGKAVDKSMVIEGVRIIEKRGGRSGHWRAEGAP